MRLPIGLLPPALSWPRLPARRWLTLAAALGAGACGYAGLYPRFDDGALRIVLAITSAPFAAGVVAAALRARTAGRGFALAMLLATGLGIASTIVPAALLSGGNPDRFAAMGFFGAMFGAPTGAAYGLPLAVLAALGHRHVRAGTHEATDRAARIAGAWLFFVALTALAVTWAFDAPMMDLATSMLVPAFPLPAVLACGAALAALVFVVRASGRLHRRAAWLERVRRGVEPAFRLRVADVRDHLDGLPCLGHASSSDGESLDDIVVEWRPDDVDGATSGMAYRACAAGRAIAVVRAGP